MKKLIITTYYPETVEDILKRLQLIEHRMIPQGKDSLLVLDYLDDALSQEADLWLGIAKVASLIEDYRLDS